MPLSHLHKSNPLMHLMDTVRQALRLFGILISFSIMPKYKLVFFTPRASTQTILQHLFSRFPNHVGRIGAYGGCAFVTPGTGA
ncbi:hypothetical protein NUW54_g6057 [Trametes sanguinea]|uniref:Uncharacterized protein n=1 Tax=Trametes sanguinea TaxID=158606 RepID=A0ACC1PV76_9APHY|nr:hypothetical protein NUW54_g6057 [Trametes sanguinea]